MLTYDTKRAEVCTCPPDPATDCLRRREDMKVVSDWYRGLTGLVTGGTGFMEKVLLKLARSEVYLGDGPDSDAR